MSKRGLTKPLNAPNSDSEFNSKDKWQKKEKTQIPFFLITQENLNCNCYIDRLLDEMKLLDSERMRDSNQDVCYSY